MSEYLEVRLCEGKRVRDPHSGTYLEAGKVYRFPRAQFWMMRLKDKDVALAIAAVQSKEKPKPIRRKKKAEKKSGDES